MHLGIEYSQWDSRQCWPTLEKMVSYQHGSKTITFKNKKNLWWSKSDKHLKTRGVSRCGLATYIKKYLNAKEELWKLKYFTMQKIIFQSTLCWVLCLVKLLGFHHPDMFLIFHKMIWIGFGSTYQDAHPNTYPLKPYILDQH